MRHSIRTLLLIMTLVLVLPRVALSTSHDQGDDAELSRVTFHTEDLDAEAERVLRESVGAAWAVLEPYVGEYGLSEFPQTQIWGFDDRETAIRVSGLGRNIWRFSGYASGSRAPTRVS